MPYKSEAQRKYMHAAADRGDVPKKVVDEFDKKSKGKKDLPEHISKAREEAKASLNKLNEKLDDQFFKSPLGGEKCDPTDEENVEKGLRAATVNSLARRERMAHAIAAYDEPGTYGAGITSAQPAIGTNRVGSLAEPPVVPVRRIESPFEMQPVSVEVYKSCNACGYVSKSLDSGCTRCASLKAASATAPEIWRR